MRALGRGTDLPDCAGPEPTISCGPTGMFARFEGGAAEMQTDYNADRLTSLDVRLLMTPDADDARALVFAGPAAAPRCVARGHLVTCTLEAADFKPLPSVFP